MKDAGVALSNLAKQALLIDLSPEDERRVMDLILKIKSIFDKSNEKS